MAGFTAALIGSALIGGVAQASAANRQRKAAREQERRIQEQERRAREQAQIEENRSLLSADEAVADTAKVELGRNTRATTGSKTSKKRGKPAGAVSSRVGGLMTGDGASRRIGL